MSDIQKLLDIMAALRHPESGCPWDLEQDFDTIAPFTVEEAYEVADAIAEKDYAELRGELGDLLFQVVFHARMAEEQSLFDFGEVVDAISDKMLRRHPHVFGSEEERAAGPVEGSWERIKATERGSAQDSSVLAGVARALPALKRAQKLGERAATVGFDWSDQNGVRSKIVEEVQEVADAVGTRSPELIEEEIGDLLHAVVSLARHLEVDPEQALTKANRKFERRFRLMESEFAERGEDMSKLGIESLEQAWRRAKSRIDEAARGGD